MAGTSTTKMPQSNGSPNVSEALHTCYSKTEVSTELMNLFTFISYTALIFRPTHSSLYLLLDQDRAGSSAERLDDEKMNVDPAKLGNMSCVTKFVKTLLCLVSNFSYTLFYLNATNCL